MYHQGCKKESGKEVQENIDRPDYSFAQII